jgi:YQGE family putative transporter
MGLVGSEGSLGILQSAGAALSAVLLYILGRKATPEHRLKIFGIGLGLFLLGAAANAALYSVAGVLIFVACLVFARPLLDLAYFPIQLGVTELVAAIERKNQFTYIFRHELGVYAGRVLGSGMFITVYHAVSKDWALRYALFIVAIVYFLSLLIARTIVNDPVWHEPSKGGPLPVEQLKEPLEL